MKYTLPIFIIILLGCNQNVDQDKLIFEKLNPSAEIFFSKAVEFEKNNQLDSAIIYICKADEAHSNHPYILHKRALILSFENNYLGSALIDMDKSIKLTIDKKLKKIRYNDRGVIFYKMGEVNRAFNDWLKAKEYGVKNIQKHRVHRKNISINRLPKYYSLDDPTQTISLFEINFPKDAFHKDGGLLKGEHIIFTQKPKAGILHKLVANSKIILIPNDSSISINKINDTTFDLFIPREYTENLLSYDVFIAPNRGYYLATYFSNRLVSYPDTLQLCLKKVIIRNDE